MRARLAPLGTDFGHGERDALHLQLDDEYGEYWLAKRAPGPGGGAPPWRRHALVDDTPSQRRALMAGLAWLRDCAAREAPAERLREARAQAGIDPASGSLDAYASSWDETVRNLQEDVVLMHRAPGEETQAIMLHVCFPSSWSPQAAIGRSFQAIHGPVPAFADAPAEAARMEDAMLLRGPFVRFVWSLSPDGALDHDSTRPGPTAWAPGATRGWLRVERQVTVPLAGVDAALFLIRVYRTPFAALSTGQRDILARALAAMPPDVLRYKGLEGRVDHVRCALAAAPRLPP